MKVLMSAGKVEPHIAGRKADINLCIYPVEVQALLLSVFSVSVLPSDVVIPTASKRRPPRRRSTRPSPPLGLRAAAPRQRAAGGGERTADPRRSRIERHAAHARKWESGGRASSAGGGGMSGAVGMLTMRRLQAPARHKPGI